MRLRLAVLYHVNERTLERMKVLASSSREMKPMGKYMLNRLTSPWSAPTLSPDEEAMQVNTSDIMGKFLILDKEQCDFFKEERRPEDARKRRLKRRPRRH